MKSFKNMELKEVIKKRKSVRVFKETDVDRGLLENIVSLAKTAPSAGGLRGYEVIMTKDRITRINAPIYMVICINEETYAKRYGERGKSLYAVQDATIFGAYIQLLLVDAELSSCWIGALREEKVKRVIGTNLRPIAIIAVGYK